MTQTHMAREIAEIPGLVESLLRHNKNTLADIGRAMRALDPQLLTTVARGSSDHAATYLKYACEILTGVPVGSVGPSVASVYGAKLRLPRTVSVGISQSGRSPDIVTMTRASASAGATTLAITNHPDAPLGADADFCLPLGCGPEQSVAATKTFVTSVVAALAMLAHWTEDAALKSALARLPEACEAALLQDWAPLADRLVRAPALFVLGRGPGYAIASEIALKFKETSALHAEAYSAAEVMHGPSALVERGFSVLGLIFDDPARDGFRDTAARLAGQGADVFVTDSVAGTTALPRTAPLHPLLDPLLSVVSFYVFIEALARRRGLQPDTPRHLRKVTETV